MLAILTSPTARAMAQAPALVGQLTMMATTLCVLEALNALVMADADCQLPRSPLGVLGFDGWHIVFDLLDDLLTKCT